MTDSQPNTFASIFYSGNKPAIRVPDYQRAFSWKEKQIELFIEDLTKHSGHTGSYYFGHFISESSCHCWDLVDGQQRVTTFVLFLIVCRHLAPDQCLEASALIERFSTVTYDQKALEVIIPQAAAFNQLVVNSSSQKTPSDKKLTSLLGLNPEKFTRSQKRIVLALLQFHRAFHKGDLKTDDIPNYVSVIMTAEASHHSAKDKTVAVNVFEMHNTRGLPLTTMEIVKAKLMKFVYDHGGPKCDTKIADIQSNFGEIYRLEERLSQKSFRGDLTLEQLLRLHLRVIDDGSKSIQDDFWSPAVNASADDTIAYLEKRLSFTDRDGKQARSPEEGVTYACAMVKKLVTSVKLVCNFLPSWDENEESGLVGDVLILERELSCQFFLLMCRRNKSGEEEFSQLQKEVLILWERLLFTRNFHDKYHGLNHNKRDNFPLLFQEAMANPAQVTDILQKYLQDGFRSWDLTKDLQDIVRSHFEQYRENILNDAYSFWTDKIVYGIYKYETSKEAKIRDIMKGTISIEHILPQQWTWIRDKDSGAKEFSDNQWKGFQEKINNCINGIGNLIPITPRENSSVGNKHPADKEYSDLCSGGSYEKHNIEGKMWRDPSKWEQLIEDRGKDIYDFILKNLIGNPLQAFENEGEK